MTFVLGGNMIETSELFITAAGREKLETELRDCNARLQKSRAERLSAPADARSSSKGVGSCALPDEEDRLEARLTKRVEGIRVTLHARTAPVPTHAREVAIGTYITTMYRIGKSVKIYDQFEVVGFNETECGAQPPKLCYQSQYVVPFLGAQKGDYELLERGGKKRKVWVTNIRLVHPPKRKRTRS